MTYFRATTDASDLYRPNSAAGSVIQHPTAVIGNLSDLMKNATIYRATFIVPEVVYVKDSETTTQGIDSLEST